MPSALQYSFRVGLAEVGPPGWRFASAPARAALRLALVAFCLEEKDKDLAMGIGADGEALAPLSAKTRETRRSAMGPADPNAPPLVPAHGLSRARSLLTGKPTGTDAAVFYWRYDRRTGASWGKILDYHRRGDGPFPARDVIGLSPARRAIVRARLAAWWPLYLANAVPVPVAAAPQALPDPAPPFLTKAVPAYVPKYPELAVAKNPKRVGQVEINGRVFTFGGSVGGKASTAGLKRAIAHGKFSGFTKYDPQTGLPLPKGPPPPPPPPPPPLAPKAGGPSSTPPPAAAAATLVKPKARARPTKPTAKPDKPRAAPSPFPSDPDAIRVVRPLGGSTGAELVEDADGNRFVRKRGGNPAHLREEATADELYRALGIDVPDSRLYERTGAPPVKLARFVEGAVSLGDLERSDPARHQAAVAKVREGLAADALLGNWDVVGLHHDNVLVAPDGRVFRVDNGGALRYRAQGQPKGTGWGGEVAELYSLRDATVNPSAARVFEGLSNADARAQAKALVRKRAAILKAAPEAVRTDLAARLDDLKAWADKEPPTLPKDFRPPTADHQEFDNFSAANDWGKAAFREWADALSEAEKEKISYYSSEGYEPMNAAVRAVARTAREGRAAAREGPATKLLADALEGGRLKENVIAWRGTMDFRALGAKGLPDFVPGLRIEEAAFASTSLLRDVARTRAKTGPRPVLFKAFLPRGAPGGYLNATGDYSAVPHEAEFLLPPGRGVWRVFKGPSPGDDVPEVWVEWVKQ